MQEFDEDNHEEQIGIRSEEMLIYFGIADDNYISDSVCNDWTTEKRMELSKFYQDKLIFYCEDYNFEMTKKAERAFFITMISITAGILLMFFIMCCWMVSFPIIIKKICDIVTFRWVLWFIIKLRYGAFKNKVTTVIADASSKVDKTTSYHVEDEDEEENPFKIKKENVEKCKHDELERQK
jgi:hypothetical protein